MTLKIIAETIRDRRETENHNQPDKRLEVLLPTKLLRLQSFHAIMIKTGNSDTVNYRGQWEKYRAMGVSGIYSDAL